MKVKYGFLASVAALTAFFSSCEDKCVNCNCDAFQVDYVDNVDSTGVALSELSAGATVIIHGSGLSTTTGVFLVKDNDWYPVDFNPNYVTDESVIVTLTSAADNMRTDQLVLRNAGGCDRWVELAKPVPSPSIKMFRSEFVPEGGTLRIAGNAFLSVGGDELEVFFFDENDEPIKAEYEVKNDSKELLVKVPAGVADSKPVLVKNQFGECYSSMLFRDRRNIFLDFDNTIASDLHGALDTFSTEWNDFVKSSSKFDKFEAMKTTLGGMPNGCDGYYAVITTPTEFGFNTDEMIYYTPYSQGQEEKSLMGQWENEMDLDKMVLKFEVLVPKEIPLAQWFYIVFSAYGSEDDLCTEKYKKPVNCGFFSRDMTNLNSWVEETQSCEGKGDGTAGAWLNMVTLSVDESESPSATVKDPFHTDGDWMTIAVPLTSAYFRYNISKYNMVTNANFISCGQLTKRDMYNMLLHAEGGGAQDKTTPEFAGKFFVAFDNFRVVPDDNGGVRFSKYYGATAASKYPF